MPLIVKVIAIAASLYLAIVALMFVFQRNMMYFPDPIRHVPPSH